MEYIITMLGQIMLRNETASRLFREEIKMGFDLKQNQHVRHYSR